MSTYQELKGLKVKYLSADTADDRAKEGEIFYNSSAFTMGVHVASQAWVSASSTINLTNSAGGSGTQTAALSFGGRNPSAPAFVSTTEEYNGSGWSAGGALNTARSYIAGMGTSTASLGAGGRINAPGTNTADVEEYNGTAWTEGPNLNTGRRLQNAGCGTTTAGLVFGGPPDNDDTEEYDGTSWTESGNMTTGRTYLAGFGIQTAAVAATGQNTSGDEIVTTEEYNGSTWSNAEDAPTATQSAAAAGILTSGLIFGGEIPPNNTPTNKAFAYDGTSWAALPNMGTAGFSATGHGTRTAALVANLRGPGGVTRTAEKFNVSILATTAAAWASGGTLNTKHNSAAASGTQTANLVAGGNDGDSNPPHVYSTPNSEEYDGTSWSEGNNLNTSRFSLSGSGSQTAGLAAGGNLYPGKSNATEEYDGSSWTTTGNLPTGVDAGTMFGIQTASVFCGGYAPTATTASAEYNGSSWTAGNAMNTARKEQPGGFGLESAGIAFAGTGPGTSNVTESYDGTNWTTVNTMNFTHTGCWAAGTQSDGVGGGGGPSTTNVENYDGTTWRTGVSLATGRNSANGCGSPSTASAALVTAGEPSRQATEEFTGETTAASAKTIDFD